MFYEATFIECIQNKLYFLFKKAKWQERKKREEGGRKEGERKKERDTYSDEILFTPLDAYVWPQGNVYL